jgi:hypothetical protein
MRHISKKKQEEPPGWSAGMRLSIAVAGSALLPGHWHRRMLHIVWLSGLALAHQRISKKRR